MLREPVWSSGMPPHRIEGTLNAHSALKPREKDELIRLGARPGNEVSQGQDACV